MAQDTAERFAEARETLAEADEALGFKLSELMADGPMETLTLTANTQPAIVAHSVAVVRVLPRLVAPSRWRSLDTASVVARWSPLAR